MIKTSESNENFNLRLLVVDYNIRSFLYPVPFKLEYNDYFSCLHFSFTYKECFC